MEDEIHVNQKRGRNNERVATIIGMIMLFGCLYVLALIGVRIAQLIISIVNIIDEFKLFYLLLIISFILFCSSFVSIFGFKFSKSIFLPITLLIGIIILGMDAFCYYLYFNEEVNHKAVFILLIYSDCAILPLIIIGIISQTNIWENWAIF